MIFAKIPFQDTAWSSILLVCKNWNSIGKELLDPSILNNYLIRREAISGTAETVRSLLECTKVKPSGMDNLAIRFAGMARHS
jgi:hypothetical protein